VTSFRPPALAIVVKGYPRLSETFVARELEALERRGLGFSLHALRQPAPDARLTRYGLAAECQYLPEYLHSAPLSVAGALLHAAQLKGFRGAFAAFLRDLWLDPSRARVRRFGQACVLAVKLSGQVRHIHCHFAHSPASVVRYAALLLGAGYSISAHAKDVWTDPAWDLARKLLGARFVTTCNGAALERLRALAPDADIRLIYHGVEAGLVVRTLQSAQRDGSDPSDPVRLLSVARAVRKKGLFQLVEALARAASCVHVRLDHYGDGPLLEPLRQRVQQLDLQHLVTFHGARAHADIIAAMDRSDLFLFPADVGPDGDRDGLPNALLEANARGLCVVASDAGGLRDGVRHGESGVLVSRGDVGSFAQSIVMLARDPAERLRLAQAALRLNAHLFDGESGYDVIAALLRREAGLE
jgi:glycosyltransferase involved in cell wall biosynthesis